MNTRNINAAGKPQTIRTALEKLSAASERRCRRCHAQHLSLIHISEPTRL